MKDKITIQDLKNTLKTLKKEGRKFIDISHEEKWLTAETARQLTGLKFVDASYHHVYCYRKRGEKWDEEKERSFLISEQYASWSLRFMGERQKEGRGGRISIRKLEKILEEME